MFPSYLEIQVLYKYIHIYATQSHVPTPLLNVQAHQHHRHNHPVFSCLFDLLLLQLDSLIVDKDTLALVRLGLTPFAQVGGELHDLLLVDAFKQHARRLRRTGLHAFGQAHFNRVREAQLERHELLPGILLQIRPRLDRCPVTNTNQPQDGRVTF